MSTPEADPTAAPADEVEQSRMTLGEHLDELRGRLVRAAIALAVVFAAAWTFNDDVARVALAPLEEKARPWLNEDIFEHEKERLYRDGEPTTQELEAVFWDGEVAVEKLKDPIPHARTDGPGTGFVFYLKVCGFASFFIAGPYVLWQLWAFIAAGLYKHERKAVYRYFPASVALFFAGVLFGYFYLVPYAYYYLTGIGLETMRHDPRIDEYLVFLKSLGLGMGLVFQLPILMMGLSRAGLIDPKNYSRFRGHFVVGAFVLASIITPPDPYTMTMMAAPMAVLYEIGTWLSRLAVRRAKTTSTSLEPSP